MAKRIILFIGVLVVVFLIAKALMPPVETGFAIGQAAPDFSATTVDGKPIRLSELRGKVVVLDFWATWCPPCVAMIPHEREMVKRLRDKPFVFLGISADDNLGEFKGFLQGRQMDWPNILDGPGGPIQDQFRIKQYPTIYVLDKEGVIRYKDLRGPDLEHAVEGLLDGR